MRGLRPLPTPPSARTGRHAGALSLILTMQAPFSPAPTVALSSPAGPGVPRTPQVQSVVHSGSSGAGHCRWWPGPVTGKPVPHSTAASSSALVPALRPPPGPGGFCHSARALSIARETALCHGPAAPLRRPPGLVSGSASQRPLLPADLGQDKKAGSEGWGAALQQSNASLYCGTSRGRFRNVPEAWAAGRPPPVSGGTVAWPRGASVSPSVGTRTAALRAVVGSAAHAGEGGGARGSGLPGAGAWRSEAGSSAGPSAWLWARPVSLPSCCFLVCAAGTMAPASPARGEEPVRRPRGARVRGCPPPTGSPGRSSSPALAAAPPGWRPVLEVPSRPWRAVFSGLPGPRRALCPPAGEPRGQLDP